MSGRRRIPRHAPAFLLINALTFALDLAILSGLHTGLRWPLPLSITIGYGTALAVSFVVNRRLNFRSHGAVRGQLGRYLPVVAVNYVALVLGLGDGLAYAGLDYHLARVAAGAAELVFMYSAMRWLIFRDTAPRVQEPNS